MASYRIDIKKDVAKLPFIYALLKWIIFLYVAAAAVFLFSKMYTLFFRRIAISEWLAIGINLLLIAVLLWQALRLNEVRWLVITEDQIKFRQRFPWHSTIKWNRVNRIQFGYSSVRFISKNGKRYRFSLTKITQEEQAKFFAALEETAKKYTVDVVRPM
jgi:hypothetical protein